MENLIKYLRIHIVIPLQNDTLIKLNLDLFAKSIQRQLGVWNKARLSWFGHMAAIKMKILPQLLFVFRSVILKVTKFKICEIQKILERFIWEGKKTRFNMPCYNKQGKKEV